MFNDNTLKALASENPLGFYVCDFGVFDRNYRAFHQAFSKHYNNIKIAYSYKTNYMPALCQRINKLGGYAEVVSRMEYDLALKLGVVGSDIIFNGPLKTADDYLYVSKNNSLMNLSEAYEVDIIQRVSRDYKRLRHRLGIRCAINLENETPSRFGFDIKSKQFQSAIQRIQSLPNVELEGLHCHMIPAGRRPEDYQKIAKTLIEESKGIWGKECPGFLDLGGGYFSNMSDELKGQFKIKIPSFAEYGEAITEPFISMFGKRQGPQLILEPGLALVADAFSFVCKVVDVKQVVNRNIALASGSVYNIIPTKSPRNLPLRHVTTGAEQTKSIQPPIDIVGYTCMEDDCMYRGYDKRLNISDVLVFGNVGAYTLVLKPPFINGNVPVYAYREGSGSIDVLKREETLEDIISTYTIDHQ
jgi:diaminopimelate decarboxylase